MTGMFVLDDGIEGRLREYPARWGRPPLAIAGFRCFRAYVSPKKGERYGKAV